MIVKPSALERMLDPVITPELAERIVAYVADEATQSRVDELADKSTEGQLTPDEREEYEDYVIAFDLMAILQSKARQVLRNQAV